jgi:hypothetical protein
MNDGTMGGIASQQNTSEKTDASQLRSRIDDAVRTAKLLDMRLQKVVAQLMANRITKGEDATKAPPPPADFHFGMLFQSSQLLTSLRELDKGISILEDYFDTGSNRLEQNTDR